MMQVNKYGGIVERRARGSKETKLYNTALSEWQPCSGVISSMTAASHLAVGREKVVPLTLTLLLNVKTDGINVSTPSLICDVRYFLKFVPTEN